MFYSCVDGSISNKVNKANKVLMAIMVNVTVFSDVTPCSLQIAAIVSQGLPALIFKEGLYSKDGCRRYFTETL